MIWPRIRLCLFLFLFFFIRSNALAEYVTPPVWEASKKTVVLGRLEYKGINVRIAPGCISTFKSTERLLTGSVSDLRDTFLEAPSTLEKIYQSGIVQNYFEYTRLASGNWEYSKLSRKDFSAAVQAYAQEGNWGILQTVYYSLKGSVRVIWALAILNSAEAMYKTGDAVVSTIYYVLKYPAGAAIKAAAAPVVLVGGTVWSTGGSLATTGWALPFTAVVDTGAFILEKAWPE